MYSTDSAVRPHRGGALRRALARIRHTAGPQPLLAAATAAATVVSTTLALEGPGDAAGFSLALTQTVAVAWLFACGWSRARRWATATCVLAVAWCLIFLVSSWIYVADPSLLDAGRPEQALGIVTLSLLCLICGHLIGGNASGETTSERMVVDGHGIHRLRLALWYLLGIGGFAALMLAAGGPIHFVRHLDQEGSLTAGLSYLIALALATKFVALAAACDRWARGQTIGRATALLLVITLAVIATLGARLFVAGTLAELFLFYALVRRRVSLSLLLPAAAVLAIAVVLVFGAVKRYGNYRSAHPHSGATLIGYLRTAAWSELPAVYANNYADGVRLIAVGRAAVPHRAGYEYGKALLRIMVQPAPRAIRPRIATAPAITTALYPSTTNTYAMPLQVIAYTQLGLGAVAVVFVLLGWALAVLDRRLATPAPLRLSSALFLVALAVEIPSAIRASMAGGVAFAVIEAAGLWVVTRTSERSPGRPNGQTGPLWQARGRR